MLLDLQKVKQIQLWLRFNTSNFIVSFREKKISELISSLQYHITGTAFLEIHVLIIICDYKGGGGTV
jgi:hypothetical protein